MNTNIASQVFAIVRDLLMPRPDAPIARQTPQAAVFLPSQAIVGISGHEARKSLTDNDLVLMAIKLSSMINTPIKHLQVLARYRCVYVVGFEPWGWIDPVMPLTAVSLGREHDSAYRELAYWLQRWQPGIDSHTGWYKEARHYATRCAAFAATRLELDEAQYYTQELFHSISLPAQRR